MREITHHFGFGGSELNSKIQIIADDRDENGGSHDYKIGLRLYPDRINTATNELDECDWQNLHFQQGPLKVTGLNGISDEALLAIVIDRLEGFQEGPTPGGRGKYCSRDNAIAITHLETAMLWLRKRTQDRQKRGVEGTHQV